MVWTRQYAKTMLTILMFFLDLDPYLSKYATVHVFKTCVINMCASHIF